MKKLFYEKKIDEKVSVRQQPFSYRGGGGGGGTEIHFFIKKNNF